jgi:hypothetical protein
VVEKNAPEHITLTTVFKDYYESTLYPLMKPFSEGMDDLFARDFLPSLQNVEIYMREMEKYIQTHYSSLYQIDTYLKHFIFAQLQNNNINVKQKKRTHGNVLSEFDKEGFAVSFVNVEDDFKKYAIEQTDYTIPEVEAQSIFLTPKEAANERTRNLKGCGNKQCVINLLLGHNNKVPTTSKFINLIMVKERSKEHLEKNIWVEDGKFEYCWICNFLISFIEIFIHLINNDAKFVTSGLFTVKAGTDEDAFPADDCFGFDNPAFDQVQNLFGMVLAPIVPFRNFAPVEKEDGTIYLKYYQCSFQ